MQVLNNNLELMIEFNKGTWITIRRS